MWLFLLFPIDLTSTLLCSVLLTGRGPSILSHDWRDSRARPKEGETEPELELNKKTQKLTTLNVFVTIFTPVGPNDSLVQWMHPSNTRPFLVHFHIFSLQVLNPTRVGPSTGNGNLRLDQVPLFRTGTTLCRKRYIT